MIPGVDPPRERVSTLFVGQLRPLEGPRLFFFADTVKMSWPPQGSIQAGASWTHAVTPILVLFPGESFFPFFSFFSFFFFFFFFFRIRAFPVETVAENKGFFFFFPLHARDNAPQKFFPCATSRELCRRQTRLRGGCFGFWCVLCLWSDFFFPLPRQQFRPLGRAKNQTGPFFSPEVAFFPQICWGSLLSFYHVDVFFF